MLSHAVENAFMKVLFSVQVPLQPAMQDCELYAAPEASSGALPSSALQPLLSQPPFTTHSPVYVTQTLKRAREGESNAGFGQNPLDSAFFPTIAPAAWWPSPSAPPELQDEDMDSIPSPLKRHIGSS